MNAIVELPTDHRRHAKHLYWQGYRVCEIAELIGEKEKTLHSWKARDEWDRATPLERIQAATGAYTPMGPVAALLLLVLALVIQYTPLHQAQWWQESALAPWLTQGLALVLPALPAQWEQYLPGTAAS